MIKPKEKYCKKCEHGIKFNDTDLFWCKFEFLYETGYCLECLIDMNYLPKLMLKPENILKYFNNGEKRYNKIES